PGRLIDGRPSKFDCGHQGVARESNGAIDLIPPPYSKAKALISNLDQPVALSVNAHESLLFASSFDHYNPTVWVFSYPAGKLKVTLGSKNGLVFPLGVAASPDDTL
ncbi:MAG TPA: hypothetical protein VGI19_19395, partial [Candidatus Cybelea sp.]